MVTWHIYKCSQRLPAKWDEMGTKCNRREWFRGRHLLSLDVQWKLSTDGTFDCQAPALTELSACSMPPAPLWLKGFISLLLASFACGAAQKPGFCVCVCMRVSGDVGVWVVGQGCTCKSMWKSDMVYWQQTEQQWQDQCPLQVCPNSDLGVICGARTGCVLVPD